MDEGEGPQGMVRPGERAHRGCQAWDRQGGQMGSCGGRWGWLRPDCGGTGMPGDVPGFYLVDTSKLCVRVQGGTFACTGVVVYICRC